MTAPNAPLVHLAGRPVGDGHHGPEEWVSIASLSQYRAALVEWQLLAGDVPVNWAIEHRRESLTHLLVRRRVTELSDQRRNRGRGCRHHAAYLLDAACRHD